MADIKLCDKCGGVFNPRGAWQSLNAATFVIDETTGRQVRHDFDVELCGGCAIDPRNAPAPTTPELRGALVVARQQVDPIDGVWQEADGSFSVDRDDGLRIGPFSSQQSASDWLHNRKPEPRDRGSEG